MSEYEDFEVENNNKDSEPKPYNMDPSDWSVDGHDLKERDNKKISYEDTDGVATKINKKKRIIIISLIAGIILIIAIVLCVILYFNSDNSTDNEMYDYVETYENVDDESSTSPDNEFIDETAVQSTETETVTQGTETSVHTTSVSSNMITIPWAGTEWDAYELLESDFNLSVVYVYSSSTAMYDVYDMEPAAGSVVERGSNVTVYVSLGDAQNAWSDWTEDWPGDNPDIEYDSKDQYRYSTVCEVCEYVDGMLVSQRTEYSEWSDWLDGDAPDYLYESNWWSDENYEYYEYADVEYRPVYRYRVAYTIVD